MLFLNFNIKFLMRLNLLRILFIIWAWLLAHIHFKRSTIIVIVLSKNSEKSRRFTRRKMILFHIATPATSAIAIFVCATVEYQMGGIKRFWQWKISRKLQQFVSVGGNRGARWKTLFLFYGSHHCCRNKKSTPARLELHLAPRVSLLLSFCHKEKETDHPKISAPHIGH
jgi:hypothetical protein